MVPSPGGWSVPLSGLLRDPRGIAIGSNDQDEGVSSSYVRRTTEGRQRGFCLVRQSQACVSSDGRIGCAESRPRSQPPFGTDSVEGYWNV
jgi:hypothetical protein